MNIIALTDSKLANLHRKLTNEIARRTKAAANDHDPAAIIFGNETAKRALIVAAAGEHSILFIGPPNCGKTMLRAVGLALGLSSTFEARPCPCGHRTSPSAPCACTVKQVDRHLRKQPPTDITVDLRCPTEQEIKRPGTTLADIQQQVAAKSDYDSTLLDEGGKALFDASVRNLSLDVDRQRRVLSVARTIANLDRSERICPQHLSEAINYRSLGD